jgi:hypothetical protein
MHWPALARCAGLVSWILQTVKITFVHNDTEYMLCSWNSCSHSGEKVLDFLTSSFIISTGRCSSSMAGRRMRYLSFKYEAKYSLNLRDSMIGPRARSPQLQGCEHRAPRSPAARSGDSSGCSCARERALMLMLRWMGWNLWLLMAR